jgi:hypothetical protein
MLTSHFTDKLVTFGQKNAYGERRRYGDEDEKIQGAHLLRPHEVWSWCMVQRPHLGIEFNLSYTSIPYHVNRVRRTLEQDKSLDLSWFRYKYKDYDSGVWGSAFSIPSGGCSLDHALTRIFLGVSKACEYECAAKTSDTGGDLTQAECHHIRDSVYNACMAHVPRDLIQSTLGILCDTSKPLAHVLSPSTPLT